jgi:multisubunit Na+/H+ antiporter MnhF subunit
MSSAPTEHGLVARGHRRTFGARASIALRRSLRLMRSGTDLHPDRLGVQSQQQSALAAVARSQSRRPPSLWWAILGAVVFVFEAYVVVRWVTGPYFKQVPSGPSVPPTWMKVVLISLQVVLPIAAAAMVYRVIVRPWRSQRTVTTDGLICIAFLFLVFQDPLANYFAPYMTYNAYMVNFGSWVKDVPGWQSVGHPGAMLVDPIIFTPANYMICPLLTMMGGCKALDWLQQRWRTAGKVQLIMTLFAGMVVVWPIIEGGAYMPLGIFTFAGGSLSIFPDAYHKYPIEQVVTASAFMTAFTAFRWLRGPDGRSFAERGVERLGLSTTKTVVARFLAVLGAGSLIYFATYNLPLFFLAHDSGNWPAAVQSRSYLTDHICGDGTGRVCPGSASPDQVRYGTADGGPFNGPILGNTTRP